MRKNTSILKAKEIQKVIKKFPDWKVSVKNTYLYRTFTFKNYIDALIFIARISVHAEILKHHPDIEFSYCKVKIKLSTHELKAITKLDIELLKRIEKLKID